MPRSDAAFQVIFIVNFIVSLKREKRRDGIPGTPPRLNGSRSRLRHTETLARLCRKFIEVPTNTGRRAGKDYWPQNEKPEPEKINDWRNSIHGDQLSLPVVAGQESQQDVWLSGGYRFGNSDLRGLDCHHLLNRFNHGPSWSVEAANNFAVHRTQHLLASDLQPFVVYAHAASSAGMQRRRAGLADDPVRRILWASKPMSTRQRYTMDLPVHE